MASPPPVAAVAPIAPAAASAPSVYAELVGGANEVGPVVGATSAGLVPDTPGAPVSKMTSGGAENSVGVAPPPPGAVSAHILLN